MVATTKAAPGIPIVWMKPRKIARCTSSWCNKCDRNGCDGHIHILCPVEQPWQLMYDRVICHVGPSSVVPSFSLFSCSDMPSSFHSSSSSHPHHPLAPLLFPLPVHYILVLPLVGLLLSLVSPRWLVMPLPCFVCLLARGWCTVCMSLRCCRCASHISFVYLHLTNVSWEVTYLPQWVDHPKCYHFYWSNHLLGLLSNGHMQSFYQVSVHIFCNYILQHTIHGSTTGHWSPIQEPILLVECLNASMNVVFVTRWWCQHIFLLHHADCGGVLDTRIDSGQCI